MYFSLFLFATSLLSLGVTDANLIKLEMYGQYIGGGSEIVDYNSCTKEAYVTSADTSEVYVLDMTNPSNIKLKATIGVNGITNSVAVSESTGWFAISSMDSTTGKGMIEVRGKAGESLSFETMYGPDMIQFVGESKSTIIAAIEGEIDDLGVDHPGAFAIINTTAGTIQYVGFETFDGMEDELRKSNIYISKGVSASIDFEPEFLTVSGTYVYASLQENNAIARIDLSDLESPPQVFPLGLKNLAFPKNAIDASDKDGGYNPRNYARVFAAYQPDSIASFVQGTSTFIVTANEGDVRDAVRVKDIVLSPTSFPNAALLQQDDQLGRLEVLPCYNCTAYTRLVTGGGRSFSIWKQSADNADALQLVYDSRNDFERITHEILGDNFNSDSSGPGDSRSDNKGPEPEALTIGIVRGRRFAFIGLERVGGIMVYDITNMSRIRFIDYYNNRDFSLPIESNPQFDLAPESIKFVPSSQSPIGRNMLIVANEVSMTTSVYVIKRFFATPGPLPNPRPVMCSM